MFSVARAKALKLGNVEHVDEDVMRIGYGPGSVLRFAKSEGRR